MMRCTRLGLLLLALCAVSPAQAEAADDEEVVIAGWFGSSLHPLTAAGWSEQRMVCALFDGLTELDPETSQPMPSLAASWVVSEDRRTWTFRIREGANWSDGRPITAEDFASAWTRVVDPSSQCESAYLLWPIEGAFAFNAGEDLAGLFRTCVSDVVVPAIATGASVRGDTLEREFRAVLGNSAWTHAAPHALEHVLDGAPGTLDLAFLRRLRGELDAAAVRLERAQERASREFGTSLGVFAKDARTLVVKLEEWVPGFARIVSLAPFRPARFFTNAKHSLRGETSEPFVVSGPYRTVGSRSAEGITFEKNPAWWGKGDELVPRIRLLYREDRMSYIAGLLTGEIDIVEDPPHPLPPALENDERVVDRPAFITYFLRINGRAGPLADARVRRAIGLAIDREAVLAANPGSPARQASASLVPPGIPGYPAPVIPVRHDPAAARRLLQEAGYPGGEGIPELRYVYNTSEGHRAIFEEVAEQLETELGIRLRGINLEWIAFNDRLLAGEFDIGRGGWIGDWPDPENFFGAIGRAWPGCGAGPAGIRFRAWRDLAADPAFPEFHARLEALEASGPVHGREALIAAHGRLSAEGLDAEARERHAAALRLLLQVEAEREALEHAAIVVPIYFYGSRRLVSRRVAEAPRFFEVPGIGRVPNVGYSRPLRWTRLREP